MPDEGMMFRTDAMPRTTRRRMDWVGCGCSCCAAMLRRSQSRLTQSTSALSSAAASAAWKSLGETESIGRSGGALVGRSNESGSSRAENSASTAPASRAGLSYTPFLMSSRMRSIRSVRSGAVLCRRASSLETDAISTESDGRSALERSGDRRLGTLRVGSSSPTDSGMDMIAESIESAVLGGGEDSHSSHGSVEGLGLVGGVVGFRRPSGAIGLWGGIPRAAPGARGVGPSGAGGIGLSSGGSGGRGVPLACARGSMSWGCAWGLGWTTAPVAW